MSYEMILLITGILVFFANFRVLSNLRHMEREYDSGKIFFNKEEMQTKKGIISYQKTLLIVLYFVSFISILYGIVEIF